MFKSFFYLLSLSTSALATPVVNMEKRVEHYGEAIEYNPGFGACGGLNGPGDFVVALNAAKFDEDHGGNCDQVVSITNSENGRQAVATVVDRCFCGNDGLALSPSLLLYLNNGNPKEDKLPIHWHFLPEKVATSVSVSGPFPTRRHTS
ncbi:hypothetical protein M231_02657 [Tremella mesenterica]|uniref:Barwin domain-containing protein n=1 Tax=Tremella mesenterica TaxID=5217 RepID=A0A4V1M4D8_TREME|nr:hypothetical protein M231_02657 [Tremella mesenterica]